MKNLHTISTESSYTPPIDLLGCFLYTEANVRCSPPRVKPTGRRVYRHRGSQAAKAGHVENLSLASGGIRETKGRAQRQTQSSSSGGSRPGPPIMEGP